MASDDLEGQYRIDDVKNKLEQAKRYGYDISKENNWLRQVEMAMKFNDYNKANTMLNKIEASLENKELASEIEAKIRRTIPQKNRNKIGEFGINVAIAGFAFVLIALLMFIIIDYESNQLEEELQEELQEELSLNNVNEIREKIEHYNDIWTIAHIMHFLGWLLFAFGTLYHLKALTKRISQ